MALVKIYADVSIGRDKTERKGIVNDTNMLFDDQVDKFKQLYWMVKNVSGPKGGVLARNQRRVM
jgi:hypothetical protein